MLYMGEGPRGSNGARSTLHQTPILHSATHNQTGPPPAPCWFLSGWACAIPRPLWVSPMTSPVRLESLLLLPQPPRAFSIRGSRLYFPRRWSPRLCGLVCSPPFVWFICVRMWGPGVLPAALPALLSATLESSPLGLSVQMWGRRVC